MSPVGGPNLSALERSYCGTSDSQGTDSTLTPEPASEEQPRGQWGRGQAWGRWRASLTLSRLP